MQNLDFSFLGNSLAARAQWIEKLCLDACRAAGLQLRTLGRHGQRPRFFEHEACELAFMRGLLSVIRERGLDGYAIPLLSMAALPAMARMASSSSACASLWPSLGSYLKTGAGRKSNAERMLLLALDQEDSEWHERFLDSPRPSTILDEEFKGVLSWTERLSLDMIGNQVTAIHVPFGPYLPRDQRHHKAHGFYTRMRANLSWLVLAVEAPTGSIPIGPRTCALISCRMYRLEMGARGSLGEKPLTNLEIFLPTGTDMPPCHNGSPLWWPTGIGRWTVFHREETIPLDSPALDVRILAALYWMRTASPDPRYPCPKGEGHGKRLEDAYSMVSVSERNSIKADIRMLLENEYDSRLDGDLENANMRQRPTDQVFDLAASNLLERMIARFRLRPGGSLAAYIRKSLPGILREQPGSLKGSVEYSDDRRYPATAAGEE